MKQLYPLKFKPIFKDKIWGGDKIRSFLNKDYSPLPNCGESWEISGYNNNISVVSNGFLAGNNLEELIEVYMGDLVGEKNFELFGTQFPLLIKFIDANDILSIQVHPDDEMAAKYHNDFGKTEMWYIIQADKNSQLITGFNKQIEQKTYLEHLENNTLEQILNYEDVEAGDVFFMPPGRIHAICQGILLAEIQQTSDLTYRIYDWNRKDAQGNTRELHTDLALKAIDFKHYDDYKTKYVPEENKSVNLASCNYFTTNLITLTSELHRDFMNLDSFKVYMCTEGSAELIYSESEPAITMQKGETILVPAIFTVLSLKPLVPAKFLEIYIG